MTLSLAWEVERVPDDLWWWVLCMGTGAEDLLGKSERGLDRVFIPQESFFCVPTCQWMCPYALLACGHQTSLWLSGGSCNGPDSSWGRILFGLPTPLPLSLCAPLWLCRWAFITKHFPLLLVYSLRWFCLVTLMAKRKKNESKDSVQERSLRSISVFLCDLG